MKKIILLIGVLYTACTLGAEVYSFDVSKIKEAEIKTLGGTLNIMASKGAQALAEIKNLDVKNCLARVNLKEDKELDIEISALTHGANCAAEINVSLSSKTKLDIEAYDTDVTASNFNSKLSLKIIDAIALINGFEGALEIENNSSDVEVTGIIKSLDLEGNASKTRITWLKKPLFTNIELEGTGDVVLNFPPGTNTKKIKINTKDFYGTKTLETK